MLWKSIAAYSCALVTASQAASWIVPGAVWTDTSGTKIDAHGGMIIKPGQTFYWVGQSWDSSTSPRIYSSSDLLNWYNEGLANTVQWMYRPKVFISDKYFIIWGQINRAIQGLRSTKINTGYSTYGSAMSIPPSGWSFSDCGVFVDDDGKTYWVTSADSNNIAINLIDTSTTQPTISTRIAAIEQGALEAPALFKSGSVYFLIVSSKTGYRPNPNKLYWATSLAGPWSGGTDIAPESTNTYSSQSTFVYKLAGSSQTTYIFMGDAWDTAGDDKSNYMWLPLSVDANGHTATLQDYSYWKVNPTTGVVTTSSTGKRYEAEDAVLTGNAAIRDCDSCLSKRSVHRINSGSNVTFTGIEGLGNGEKQWMSLHYTVNNATAGDAHVYVNDVKFRVRDLNTRAGTHSTVPIGVVLRRGSDNTVTFTAEGRDFEAHLDGIEVLDGTEEEIEVKL